MVCLFHKITAKKAMRRTFFKRYTGGMNGGQGADKSPEIVLLGSQKKPALFGASDDSFYYILIRFARRAGQTTALCAGEAKCL